MPEDKEKKRVYNVAYYDAHREELLAYQAAYRAEHREKACAYASVYRAANRGEIRTKLAARYLAHRDEILAKSAAEYAANPEKKRARSSAYRIEHPAERSALHAKRRALKRSATIGDPKAIKAVYRQARENKKVRCYLCGERIPMGQRHVDHIVPLSKGGTHTRANLAIACASCNMHKHAKMPEDVGLLL